MNSDSIRDALQRMPKVELHVHLEGATDADTVWTMAKRNGVPLLGDTLEAWKQSYRFRDFPHFIEVYTTATDAMLRPDDWALMVDRFLLNQSQQNIVYSEVFLSASHQIGKLPADEWISAIVESSSLGEKKYNTKVRFIPDIARQSPETQRSVLEFAVQAAKTDYFIGLGLGGIEDGYPPSLFTEVFREAKHQGLHIVAHAGETTGATTISDTLQLLKVDRIGHGIRCLEDELLVEKLRQTNMPLEVCPTSNYRLGVVAPDDAHPIRKMVDAGLACTVNTDDPLMFGTTLVDEYLLLSKQGFTREELRQLNLNAVNASFLPDVEKNALRRKLLAHV